MTEDVDFRSDKSESAEGGRVAVNRWAGYHHNLDEDVIAEAFSTPARSMEDFDPEIRDAIAEDALERSELIGFWVAWHLAGGFDDLSRGGCRTGRPSFARSAASGPPTARIQTSSSSPGSSSTSTRPGPSRSPGRSRPPKVEGSADPVARWLPCTPLSA